MHIVVHYSDIGTKGGNRTFFEKKLISNLKKGINEKFTVFRRYGRIVLKLDKNSNVFKILDRLAFFPGVSSYALSERTDLDFRKIQEKVGMMLHKMDFNTFRITARRSNKNFKLRSREINIKLGDLVRQKFQKTVRLKKSDLNLFIDIGEKDVFIYHKKYSGIGGLPVGSSGKAVVLLSGGIDSPVAAFLAAKRGLGIVLIHILNKTMSGARQGTDKIVKISRKLAKIQGKTKLFIIPFSQIQKAIIASVPAESRMIIYRRFMMKIAEMIAQKEDAGGIITGDSLGQVASQTIENLGCIYEGLKLPVLPPLIGMNKEEITSIAKRIGTYEFSIIPYPDCCSFMLAKHPETKGEIEKILKLESLIYNRDKLIKESVEKANVERITYNP